MSAREQHVICAMSDAPRDLKYRHFITFREPHLRSHSVYTPGFGGILSQEAMWAIRSGHGTPG